MKKMLVAFAMFCLPWAAVAESPTVLFKTHGDFQEIRDALQFAIEGKGLKINHTNRIAEMLARTGQDLGSARQVYVEGEQFEFCSAAISRKMMEADPHAMLMCPYILSVYTLPNDRNVYIAYRKPAATRNPALNKALAEVENLLTGIIREVL